jgi:hypothetical protein
MNLVQVAAAMHAVDPEARAWFRGCFEPPTWRDLQVVHQIYRRSREAGWNQRIMFFGASELTPQACNLIKGKGFFDGTLELAPGYGTSSDGTTGIFDWDETFNDIAAETGIAPNSHGMVFVSSSDNGDIGDGGAFGGGVSQCDVRIRSSVGALGVRAANITIQTPIDCFSVWQPKGYFNFPGTPNPSYAISRLSPTAGPPALPERWGYVLLVSNPAATFPTGKIRTWQVGSSSARSSNTIMAHIVFATPTQLIGQMRAEDIRDTFERVYQIYQTRDEVYTIVHTPPFLGPFPFTRERIFDISPSNMIVSRLVVPPINDTITNARTSIDGGVTYRAGHQFFPYNLALQTPNAAMSNTTSTAAPYKKGSLIWVNRALGPDLANPDRVSTRGNNTYGAIAMPVGIGQPMFTIYFKALIATLVQVGYTYGLLPRADPINVWDGPVMDGDRLVDTLDNKAMGWLDIAALAFNVNGWAAYEAADPTYTGKQFTGPDLDVKNATTGVVTPGTPVTNTGDVIHWKYANEHGATVFDHYSSFGYQCYDRVVLPPHRHVAPMRGGLADFEWVYTDDERSDGSRSSDSVFLYHRFSQMIHALGLKLGIGCHFTWPGGPAENSGFTQENKATILQYVDIFFLKFARNMAPKVSVQQAWDDQVNTFTGPNFDIPIDYSHLGVSPNVGARNSAMVYSQCTALNALMALHGVEDLWIVPGGAQFASKYNDPVQLALAGLLGIDPATLVGHP